MSAADSFGILASKPLCGGSYTTGTPTHALASVNNGEEARIQDGWKAVINELLRWKTEGDTLFDPEDVPSHEVIETALDLCNDYELQPFPHSITPTGSGRLTFMWEFGPETTTIEILDTGLIENTRFYNNKVVEQTRKLRVPQTRKKQFSAPY